MILGARKKIKPLSLTDLIMYFACTYVQDSQIRHGITLEVRYRNREGSMQALHEDPALAAARL